METTLRTAGVEAARDYQDLPAWTRAMSLAEAIYAATEDFPEREIAGLGAAMRASAAGVPSHIAIASARTEHGITESYSKSQSCLAELATQIELASRLGYVADTLATQIDEVGRLLIALKHGLKTEAKAKDRKDRETATLDREHAERSERFEKRAPRGEYKPRERTDRDTGREERQYKPRGEFKPRDGGDRKPYGDKKPYGDRKPYGDKKPYEKKAYGDRPARSEGEDRPRREYKPRDGAPAGERKPYGEKKAYGEKKTYGDKKPYGDRKPYGDKKPYSAKPAGDRPFRKPRDRD